MKFNIRLQNEWFVIPVNDNNSKVQWLIEKTIQRFILHATKKQKQLRSNADFELHDEKDSCTDNLVDDKSNQSNEIYQKKFNELIESVIEIRKNSTNAILDRNDLIQEILNDDDFLCIVLKSDIEEFGPFYQDDTIDKLHFMALGLENCKNDKKKTFYLDGYNLKPEDLFEIGKGGFKIDLTVNSWKNVRDGRQLLDDLIKDNWVVYGINTGFGKFANTLIDKNDLKQLQVNLIRSHASGTGKTLDIMRTRRLLLLRINVLAKGHSGISAETLQSLIDAFNNDCLSWVPEQGTVGASGDLAPLSHLALGLIGEGKMYSPPTGWASASQVLSYHNLKPIVLKPKEGIALINGTQLITSLGAEAVIISQRIARTADIISAVTLEVLKGTTRAFDSNIHDLRPHPGQSYVAETLRALLHSEIYRSEIAESHRFCQRVQDAYTIRCCPQVHGVVHDTIDFCHKIIQTEMNSATDNPLVIPKTGECLSGGNFHGEYPAKACDYLAIAVHELASISERRIERLMNTALSGLPLFLVQNGGLNSGLMIAHCTAASLVSENKVLCHPASIDSISTSAATEDHVSMGGFASRKVIQVVENVEKVLAIELLASCQALEFLRPLKSTEPIEAVYSLVRDHVLPLEKDRYLAPEIDKVYQLLKTNAIYDRVKPYIDNYKKKIKTMKKKISIKKRPPSPTTFFSNTYVSQHPELNFGGLNSDELHSDDSQ